MCIAFMEHRTNELKYMRIQSREHLEDLWLGIFCFYISHLDGGGLGGDCYCGSGIGFFLSTVHILQV